ncbi:hypothetical protein [Agreia bicolorata]|uniref:Uncharacterized protein n=1 Tax=Agreia bicolorata TaxID=110935 RepID=A0ABR5CGS0_9MICO|nr:hypothetical protein [Agreia bicolorata]KJC64780.1 hypothetical protein TZ00_03570 [Agreia bicolorata]
MDQYQWLGDLPTWITAGAVGIAALQFAADKRLRAIEEARESKAQATGLTAWTVSDIETHNPKVLGVVMSNSSGSTFHDVKITVKIDGTRVPWPISLKILPPGTYFVAHTPKGKFIWDFPLPVEACAGVLQPYMNTDDYQIESIEFADNLNQRWSTDARAVLTAL